MPDDIFSSLPRIAEVVFCRPWMVKPAFHTAVLVPQLLAAVERRDAGGARAYRDGTEKSPDEVEKERNEKLAAVKGRWLVTSDNRRAKIPYNMDDASMIGQVNVSGIIGKSLSEFDMDCGGVCVDQMRAAMAHLGELGARAVALNFDTPGGTVTGVPEAAEFVRDFDASVAPVHAYTETMCCSAGYYLASAARSFSAAQSAEIGSIGVYSAVLDSSAAFAQNGLKMHLLASGWAKGQGMRGVAVDPRFLASVQDDVDRHAERFFGWVLGQRADEIEADAMTHQKDPDEYAAAIMQGQTWCAYDAPEALLDGYFMDRGAHLRGLAAAMAARK